MQANSASSIPNMAVPYSRYIGSRTSQSEPLVNVYLLARAALSASKP